MKIRSFKPGGVQLTLKKELTNIKPIINADIPKKVTIPLQQHLGKPAECIVKVGDIVKEGEMIGRATDVFSANVHASLQGVVSDIQYVMTPMGLHSEAVVIELKGPFSGYMGIRSKKNDWQLMNRKEILSKIKEGGIVGLGGAAFPTHIKMSNPENKKLDYLIANGVECEPYLTCDHRLMVEQPENLIEGIKITQKLLGEVSCIIGIEDHNPKLIKVLSDLCAHEENIKLMIFKSKYPQGSSRQLIESCTGKETPSKKRSTDVGCVLSNIGTLIAIYEAVVLDHPLIERIVTVSGDIIKNPRNYKVRLGTSVDQLLEECEITEEIKKIIIGGPMMGYAQYTSNIPIIKNSSAVILLSESEQSIPEEDPCIRCGKCVDVCPIGLMPINMMQLVNANRYNEAKSIGIADCIECGCCNYVCPSKIPLVQYFRLGKLALKKEIQYIEHKIPILPL